MVKIDNTFWKNILLFCMVLILCFVIIELLMRFLWHEKSYGYPEGLLLDDATKGFKYRPGFDGYFRYGKYENVSIHINSKGLRDYEHNYSKHPDIIRIIGMGDSVTFGSGVDFESIYLRQLETNLLENDYNIEIIKMGVNGYEFEQEVTYFFEEGKKYIPDLVIVGVVLNDPRPVDISAQRTNAGRKDLRRFLGKYCTSCRFFYRSIESMFILKGQDYNDKYFELIYGLWQGEFWENYSAQLLDFNSALKRDGIKLVLLIFPYTQQFKNSVDYGIQPQEQIKALSETNGILYLDILPYLDRPDYKDYYLENDNVHLNAKGHKLVTDILYKFLMDSSLLIPDNQ